MADRKYKKQEKRTNNLNGNTNNSSYITIMTKATTLLKTTAETVMRIML